MKGMLHNVCRRDLSLFPSGDDILSRADIKQGLLLMTTTSLSSCADTGSPTSVLGSDWSCQSLVCDSEQASVTRKSRHEEALKPEEIDMVKTCVASYETSCKETIHVQDCMNRRVCVSSGA